MLRILERTRKVRKHLRNSKEVRGDSNSRQKESYSGLMNRGDLILVSGTTWGGGKDSARKSYLVQS